MILSQVDVISTSEQGSSVVVGIGVVVARNVQVRQHLSMIDEQLPSDIMRIKKFHGQTHTGAMTCKYY